MFSYYAVISHLQDYLKVLEGNNVKIMFNPLISGCAFSLIMKVEAYKTKHQDACFVFFYLEALSSFCNKLIPQYYHVVTELHYEVLL